LRFQPGAGYAAASEIVESALAQELIQPPIITDTFTAAC
jgi:hypothetical protein